MSPQCTPSAPAQSPCPATHTNTRTVYSDSDTSDRTGHTKSHARPILRSRADRVSRRRRSLSCVVSSMNVARKSATGLTGSSMEGRPARRSAGSQCGVRSLRCGCCHCGSGSHGGRAWQQAGAHHRAQRAEGVHGRSRQSGGRRTELEPSAQNATSKQHSTEKTTQNDVRTRERTARRAALNYDGWIPFVSTPRSRFLCEVCRVYAQGWAKGWRCNKRKKPIFPPDDAIMRGEASRGEAEEGAAANVAAAERAASAGFS